VRRLGAQRPLLPGLGSGSRGGHRRLPRGAGHLGLLHRQPRVRQPAEEVQDERHRMPRGLRAGGDQRHRDAPRAPRRRHRRLQFARGGRPLRRSAHGLGHRRLRAARAGGGDHARRGPGLRRAGEQGEPLDGPDALPGPGARTRGLPRRAREARLRRASASRRGPHQALPRRPRRRAPPEE
jgi:hypothetical protein